MNDKRTFKLKLIGDYSNIVDVSDSYINAANWLSQIVFSRDTIENPNKLAREFYSTVRKKFGLPSQVSLSLFRHIVSSYRTMKSNRVNSLAIYKKRTIPIVWKRDFNLSRRGLTIWGQKFDFRSQELPEGKWVDSKLKKINGTWYLCLVIKVKIQPLKDKGTILGVDSGIKNIATAVDQATGKTLYIKGSVFEHRRQQIQQVRAKVSSVGTPSSKRLLKRLSRKEKSVTQEAMHLASKELVSFAKSVNAMTIVLEDLSGVRKSSKPKGKRFRASIHRWPYALLHFFVEYKAISEGISTEYVDPRYTSQGCPICGHVNKANRVKLSFTCKSCGYRDNSDRIGAKNISYRSILWRQASEGRAAVNQLKVAL